MEKKISILGSTGSIGKQSIEVIKDLGLKVCAITANRSVDLLEKQARELLPEIAVAYDEDAAKDLKVRLADTPVKVLSGMGGLIEAASMESANTVITAVMGTIGLKPTMAAIKEKKRIGLANKETLVCAGKIVMEASRKEGAEIIPVDSEHSAIFQCLDGHNKSELKRILLTASGGPFRNFTADEMKNVTKEQALNHPNWNMGAKITIDSATMMNKGLEFIEAMHLFGAKPSQIKVVIHPQSIIHSMVEFTDNAVLAQLGVPDMRLPIQLAITYPERMRCLTGEVDFAKIGTLTFEDPDLNKFTCLRLAMETAEKEGAACAVMNAANETAVSLFLQDKIRFCDIYDVVSEAVEKIKDNGAINIDEILAADKEAREFVNSRA